MQKFIFPETVSEDFVSYARSFQRTLAAQNRSEATVKTYMISLQQFAHYLAAQNMPQSLEHITREHIESFLTDLISDYKPYTILTRYRGLRVFFNWLVEEGELRVSPMSKMHAPKVVESPPDILSEEQLKRVLGTCDGNSFYNRRDKCILLILLDTGMRRNEIASLKLSDIDWDMGCLHVQRAKGGYSKICPLGRKALMALDRYVRIRSKTAPANEKALWWGHKGPMGDYGIYNVVVQRCKQAGIPHAYTHLFRHQFAHEWLKAGGTEGDLQRLGGWRSPLIMRRYGSSMADQRARDSHRILSPGDKF